MFNILICDDEQNIVKALKIYLSNSNYYFYEANNGKQAVRIVEKTDIHLILMDITMPEMDGLTAMMEIRMRSNVPIILLTAKNKNADKILGLNSGADDYITKPFNPLELAARVNAQLRRYLVLGGKMMKKDTYKIGEIELDDLKKEVTAYEKRILLTPMEYKILKLFMSHPGQVYSPKEIYYEIHHEDLLNNENTIAVHIRHLREKIEINPTRPRYLKLVWGQGYKIEKSQTR